MSDTTNHTGGRRRERRVVSGCASPCDTVVTIVVAYYEDEPSMVDAMLAAANATHAAEGPAESGAPVTPSASAAG
jgi:hypothetical protein